MATATTRRDTKRQVAQEQALSLLNLTPKQEGYLHELRDLFQNTSDESERAEILDAFVEIISKDNGNSAEGDASAGVSTETKTLVEEYHRKVGKEIRKRRHATGLTQVELARKAGIPQSHVSRLEAGRHTPTHITIKKLAKALRTQPKMLDPGFDF